MILAEISKAHELVGQNGADLLGDKRHVELAVSAEHGLRPGTIKSLQGHIQRLHVDAPAMAAKEVLRGLQAPGPLAAAAEQAPPESNLHVPCTDCWVRFKKGSCLCSLSGLSVRKKCNMIFKNETQVPGLGEVRLSIHGSELLM